jgi:hypothetical protein
LEGSIFVTTKEGIYNSKVQTNKTPKFRNTKLEKDNKTGTSAT